MSDNYKLLFFIYKDNKNEISFGIYENSLVKVRILKDKMMHLFDLSQVELINECLRDMKIQHEFKLRTLNLIISKTNDELFFMIFKEHINNNIELKKSFRLFYLNSLYTDLNINMFFITLRNGRYPIIEYIIEGYNSKIKDVYYLPLYVRFKQYSQFYTNAKEKLESKDEGEHLVDIIQKDLENYLSLTKIKDERVLEKYDEIKAELSDKIDVIINTINFYNDDTGILSLNH